MAGSMKLVEGTDDTWRLRVSVGYDHNAGKYRTVQETFHGTESKAKVALAKLVTRASEGKITAEKCSVKQLLNRYLDHCRDQNIAPTTAYNYRAMADWFIEMIGSEQARSVTPSDIDALMGRVAREKGQSSADHYYRFLRAALKQGVKWGLLPTAATDRATAPSPPKPALSMPTIDGIKRLINLAESGGGQAQPNADLAAFVLVSALTGARRGETLALTVGDVDLERGQMLKRRGVTHVDGQTYVGATKTKRVYRIAIDPVAREALRQQLERVQYRCDLAQVPVTPETFVWSDDADHSRPIKPYLLTGRWRRLRKRAGLEDYRLHDLRHAAAAIMLSEGVDPVTAAGRLGHSTQTMLTHYAYIIEGKDQEAANILGRALAPAAPES